MERSNFFSRQYVDENDLNFTESSKASAIRELTQAIALPVGSYTKGVVGYSKSTSTDLFAVTGSTSSQITVYPGTAFDNDGERIYVPTDTGSMSPPRPPREDLTWSTGAGTTYVKIAYAEQSGSSSIDDWGTQQWKRYYDSYAITIDKDAVGANEVLLASFTSTAGNEVSGLIIDERTLIGGLLRGDDALSIEASGYFTGNLEVTGSAYVGSAIVANNIAVSGSVLLDDGVNIYGDSIAADTSWGLFSSGNRSSIMVLGPMPVGDWNYNDFINYTCVTGSYIAIVGPENALTYGRIQISPASGSWGMGYTNVIGRFNAIDFFNTNVESGVDGYSNFMFRHTSNSAIGAKLALYHHSENATAGDVVGGLLFVGNDSTDLPMTYSEIRSVIVDETFGSVDGELQFWVALSNSLAKAMYLRGDGKLYVDDASGTQGVYAFDEEDDPELARDLVLGENTDRLESLGILEQRESGRRSWALQPTIRLLAGACYQLSARVRVLESELGIETV